MKHSSSSDAPGRTRSREREAKMIDKEIQQAVLRELDWEPQVTSTEVGVAVEDGVVTLSGFVENNSIRHHAEKAAQRVIGVRAVANDLTVKPKNGGRSDP